VFSSRGTNVIADLFNVHFCDMPLKLLESRKTNDILPPECHRGRIQGCKNSIFLTPVTENEVVKVTRSLKNKCATGSDDIPDYVIKQSIEYLKKPLTSKYSSLLEAGVFREQLKIAKIIPVHKKGNTRNINNYRPLASLSVFFKLLE
jgi:potassium voltage-gated channel Eag-related subfamily H protein 8